MAKVKKKIKKLSSQEIKKIKTWLAPIGISLLALIILSSFFLPKDQFQRAKEKLIRHPDDFEASLILVEKLLQNNQLEETEKALLLAEKNQEAKGGIFESQASQKLNELWQQKHYSDPKEIKKLIAVWEKIVAEKPNYRDGWIQLAILHYKLYENEKAKECLEEALEIDPNFELVQKLQEVVK